MTSATTDAEVTPAELLGTAASHATRNVPVAAPDGPVDAVIAGMRGRRFDSVAVVAVCVDDRLVGLVTLERLLAIAPTNAIARHCDASELLPVSAPS